MGTSKEFAQRLRTVRKENGLSQRELAARIEVKAPTLSAYESESDNKRATPSLDVLLKIQKELDVSLDYLFGIEKKNPEDEPIEKVKHYLRVMTWTYDIFDDDDAIIVSPTPCFDEKDDLYYPQAEIEYYESSRIPQFFHEWAAVRQLYYAKTIDSTTYEGILDVLCKKYAQLICDKHGKEEQATTKKVKIKMSTEG